MRKELQEIFDEVYHELMVIEKKHKAFMTLFGGCTVILKNVYDLEDMVKDKDNDSEQLRKKVIHTAAMVIKFANNFCLLKT